MTLFASAVESIVSQAAELFQGLDGLPLEEQIDAINRIKQALHQHSPFASEPVDCVIWVPNERVQGNDYNPNKVAPPEMKLLSHSIEADGYTQPIVAHVDQQTDRDFSVIDGYHRSRVGKENKKIRERVKGYLPLAVVGDDRTGLKDRMAATIRHNRARGIHGVMPLADIVAKLVQEGWTDSELCKELGMDADEVLRFKQNTGLPELFKNHQFSRAWEAKA